MLTKLGNIIYQVAIVICIIGIAGSSVIHSKKPEKVEYSFFHSTTQTWEEYQRSENSFNAKASVAYLLGSIIIIASGKSFQIVLGGKWSLRNFWNEHRIK